MATKIKFCGITRLEDAERAVELDAWAVGLILWPGSPRYCRLPRAVEIGSALQRRAEVAGVFVNAHLDHIVRRADEIGLTLIQLHGDEGPSFCTEVARRTGARVIKVARVQQRADVQALRAFQTDYHLLDTFVKDQPGGTGATFSWELVREHRRDRPLILSGGLTPENVGDAIDATHPYAVDVSSGVELSPGIKDKGRMEAFSAAVRAADAAADEEGQAA
ncbi:phosphoribosylanthranilate isomerase [Conexibacter sp. JD483]|uniref:phosphoribosylanthranilate isomerase n=1 Tax=unclassified Conexibacter TaxID=2627773 RepID=UPI0027159B9F|nr:MULTISPECIES: phosphoribosylanthranilate isomerase [unclassified Conexibacter]MDO8184809.1 phosphoribosylanthranilate isomerase [Conexibacter sp. CPCC 205706]MDO8196584.1 phosphoribosylanthranilate isomerase [Conexibacter sp. CPCC 205762]MDR9368703.1 phosphoribosylanthranilate isomerase [Conexibacter sp. JD483]